MDRTNRFSESTKQSYTKSEKKQITINIDVTAIEYFKGQASSYGLPYQTLINLYLMDCARTNRHIQLSFI
jgi:predicted DNA binding CopG/RHH family protein